MMSPAIVSNW